MNDNNIPEFIFTDHARERLKERMGCREEKYNKIIKKAWYKGKEITDPVALAHIAKLGYKGRILKNLMGYIFIFREHKKKNEIVLITVFTKGSK